VSKSVSYILRHDPQDLTMYEQGFVDLDELVSKVKRSVDYWSSLLAFIIECCVASILAGKGVA